MSKLTRKKTLLAKIESVYGTDPTPTGGANAMLVSELDVVPIEASLVSRDLVRPYLGNSEQLLAEKYCTATFSIEAVGSGTVGLAPAYDALLRACGFTKAATTTAITITRVSAVATVALTSHGYSVGDKVVISGAVETEYNGTFTIATVPNANSFTYAVTGTPTTPATGTPVLTTAQVYTPVSSAFESATLYFNLDGILHRLTGCFGNVELDLAVKTIPHFKFTFTGIYNAPTDTAAPSVDYSLFMIPQVANTQNTPSFSLFGYSGAPLLSCNLNMSNDVKYIALIGSESVKLLDRKPAGTLVFEAPTIAAKDFFTLVSDNTSGAMAINHGSRNGYKVNFACPAVLLGNPSYQDSDGVAMLSAPFTVNPVSGNDEITITIK